MEFPFDVYRALRPGNDGIAIIRSKDCNSREVCEIIDAMGNASAKAQGLRAVITTAVRFFSSADNLLYIKIEGKRVVGVLKTGYRKLFYSDEVGRISEITPLCLLDFYVHETLQRSGHGKELYTKMLQVSGVQPNKIAIDRPSPKLISFMRKHYGLCDYIPQNNNFVIYREYFRVISI
jgi:alpha-tubulin N-acetyltransferase 1